MPKILENIKNLAHKVSEDYLLLESDMNEDLADLYENGEIENKEVLKRICEHANQNVYLGLFNQPDIDKSNITFNKADYEIISGKIKESEDAMKDYDAPPKDFRSQLETAVLGDAIKTASSNSHLKELEEIVEKRQTLKNFNNQLSIMKTAAVKEAEDSISDIANDTKIMVSNGDSIGDIAKIATRYVKENMGGDAVKIAQCYDYINNELVKDNFNVKTGFTKLSSQSINPKSHILKPVEKFATSIAKIAGLDEMIENVSNVISAFDKTINLENSI